MKGKSFAPTACAAFMVVALMGITAVSQQTYQATAVRPANVSGDLLDLANANDNRMDTRAYSSKPDYKGMSVTLDIGGEQNVIGVSMDHGRWPTHFPGAYKVEVAASASGPWAQAWEGPGQRGESKAKFPAIRARFIRVTATAVNQGGEDWTIAEIRGGVDQGQTASTIPAKVGPPADAAPPPVAKTLRDVANLTDNKLDTFATSSTPDYAGVSYTFDLGGEYELSRVVQMHGARPDDFPAEYKVEVSRERNDSRFREVWRGGGEAGRSVARFTPVVTRYVRITALRNRGGQHLWSIAELRTNRDPDPVEDDDDRANRPIRAITSEGLSNITSVIDENNTTRASTRTANYAGNWVLVDMGGSYTVSRVVQIHEPERADFPGRYRIEVSQDGNRWQTVFEGEGERNRSGASFTPARARYIRITAVANRDLQHPWSIYKLKIRG
ncbi:MAG TPA: discoidin domain-containing protein [Blastocatellia bacterium]|nr:discoidin domain-containing protein [Blastocatellia bacterium]